MFHLLEPRSYEKVRPLFAGLDFQLSASAVLDGMNPGRVYVDDPAAPRCAFMVSPEGLYLVGDPDNAAFNGTLNAALFARQLFDEAREGHYFVVPDEAWGSSLVTIFHPRPPITLPRRHYLCTALAFDWQAALPEGFAVYPVDRALLDRPGLRTPDHVHGWMAANWGSREDFLARGFGAVTVDESANKVVSWSLADCVSVSGSGPAGEIGIHTDPAYRRRGLATITAAACVEAAFRRGLTVVGWQCNEDNLGSRATAERVGFRLNRRYTMAYMYLTEADHLAEMGWVAFRAGHYQDTADLYARVFALDDDPPDYYHFLAARAWALLGDPARAMTHLKEAAARGWSDAAYTAGECLELKPLHELPEWEPVLARIRANAAAEA